MLKTPTTESSALVIWSQTPHYQTTIMEKVKCPEHQSTKMACGLSIAKNWGILRKLAKNSMESHNQLVERMENDTHNLNRGVVKPILLNLKRIPNQKSQLLMIQMPVDWIKRRLRDSVAFWLQWKSLLLHALSLNQVNIPFLMFLVF